MNMELAARIFSEGVVVYEHSGKHNNREFCGIADGHPYVRPGEKVVELDGEIYIVTMPTGPYQTRVVHDLAPAPYKR